jgi:hypothetical protein
MTVSPELVCWPSSVGGCTKSLDGRTANFAVSLLIDVVTENITVRI